MQRVCASEHSGQGFDRGAYHVVRGLRGGQTDTGGLGVEPQPHGSVVGGAIYIAQPSRPDPARSPEFCDLFEEVNVGIEEERQSGCEGVHLETAGLPQFHVGEAVGECERQLLRSRRPSLPNVIPRDAQRFVARHLGIHILHEVADEP